MSILDFLPLLAGIGLFLFGMSYLSTALEKIAGAKLEKLLEKLTKNRFKGILLGTGVTAVIQSSSATTIMVLGLLNAGIINLTNAIPVIMGANIGTTVTAQILRLGDLGGGSFLLNLLKPSSFGPIFIGVGAFFILFSKKHKHQDIGSIFLGLGMIFFGINTMETTLSPLKEIPAFTNLITMFDNPVLGVLLGAAITALLQSSSASVGIIQALSSTGAITVRVMIPIILGMNVGKCITVVLASIGGKKTSKRAVLIDVTNNLTGMFLFLISIYTYKALIGINCWDSVVSRGNIADFHTAFNLITGLILLPCIDLLVRFARFVMPDENEPAEEKVLASLNTHLLTSPNLAIEQCRKAMIAMATLALRNFRDAMSLFTDCDPDILEKINERENLLDKYESGISNYLIQVNQLDITDRDNLLVSEMIHSITDLERIGDHAVNIMEVALYDHENGIHFSHVALEELHMVGQAVSEILSLAMDGFRENDLSKTVQVEPLEEVIDALQVSLRDKHIERLISGDCQIRSGISFVELLNNLERISDHCSNIALNQIQTAEKGGLDIHEYQQEIHKSGGKAYQKAFMAFQEHYNIDRIDYSQPEPVQPEEEAPDNSRITPEFTATIRDDLILEDYLTEKKAPEKDKQKKKTKKDKDQSKAKDKDQSKVKEKDRDTENDRDKEKDKKKKEKAPKATDGDDASTLEKTKKQKKADKYALEKEKVKKLKKKLKKMELAKAAETNSEVPTFAQENDTLEYDSEVTNAQANDTLTAVPEVTDALANDTLTAVPEVTDAQANDTLTANPEVTDAQANDTLTVDPEITDAQTNDTLTADSEVTDAQANDTLTAVPEVADAQANDTLAADSEVTDASADSTLTDA